MNNLASPSVLECMPRISDEKLTQKQSGHEMTKLGEVLVGSTVLFALVMLGSTAHGAIGQNADNEQTNGQHALAIFNGRNLDGWYVYTAETQRENPGVFQVVD